MAKGLVNESSLNSIAEAINVLNGTNGEYHPSEMGAAIIDAIPTEEVTDDIVSVTDAAAYPAEGLEFGIEPVQDLHGYDNPWPAGGGKNKFNTDFESPTVKNGTTITKLSDGKVTVSGVPSASFDFIIGTVSLHAGDYILNGCPANGSATTYRLQVTDYPVVVNLGQDSGRGVSFTLLQDMTVF